MKGQLSSTSTKLAWAKLRPHDSSINQCLYPKERLTHLLDFFQVQCRCLLASKHGSTITRIWKIISTVDLSGPEDLPMQGCKVQLPEATRRFVCLKSDWKGSQAQPSRGQGVCKIRSSSPWDGLAQFHWFVILSHIPLQTRCSQPFPFEHPPCLHSRDFSQALTVEL